MKKSGKQKDTVSSHFKAILFDLGNTLYVKESFLNSAFDEVARYISQTHNLDKQGILDLLYRIWKIRTSHYEFLFEDLLQILGIYSAQSIEKVLNIYHYHNPKELKAYPGAEKLVRELRKRYKIGVVTDGHPQMQRNKIAALGWEDLFHTFVYAMEYDKSYLKPHPFIYRLATEKLGVKSEHTLYVGDNPQDDFIGAREINIFTVRVLQGEFKDLRLDHHREADVSIQDIRYLPKVLEGSFPIKKTSEMEPD